MTVCFPYIEHQVNSCEMVGNQGHGLRYSSINDGETVLNVVRSKITHNGNREIGKTETGAVYIETMDKNFSVTNSYISNNNIGGIHAKLARLPS